MNEKKSGAKTLLWSIIMSSPGPLTVGLSLLSGTSSTQIADFVRRSAELLAIITSYVIYTTVTQRDVYDEGKKRQLERDSNIFVGWMMFLAGAIMALFAFTISHEDKGNVIPGIIIALLGASANSVFWVKYTRLNRAQPNAIMAVQARLYRAKTLVDANVIIALVPVLIAPQSAVSYWFDLVGSIIVSVYMMWSSMQTIIEAKRKTKIEKIQ